MGVYAAAITRGKNKTIIIKFMYLHAIHIYANSLMDVLLSSIKKLHYLLLICWRDLKCYSACNDTISLTIDSSVVHSTKKSNHIKDECAIIAIIVNVLQLPSLPLRYYVLGQDTHPPGQSLISTSLANININVT